MQEYKMKICCHRKDMPNMCEIITLPFKPEEGDILSVKPPNGDPENRLTILVVGLIYDHDAGFFVMRPDIVQKVHNTFEGKDEVLSHNIDPLENA
jgi:hypothetical protein